MATQSEEVNRALQKLLNAKGDYKIINKEFKKLEKIYLSSLNLYLIDRRGADGPTIKREILKNENFKLY